MSFPLSGGLGNFNPFRTCACGAHKKKGAARSLALLPEIKTPAASYSPAREPRSTLGDGTLHFRVRDGNGCCLPSMATGMKIQAFSLVIYNQRKSFQHRDPNIFGFLFVKFFRFTLMKRPSRPAD